MGLFGWLMRGLGFESDDGQKKNKKNKGAADNKYANFNLHEKVGEGSTINAYSPNVVGDALNINVERNLIIHEPKNHKDVQRIVDYLRQNQSAYINLAGLDSADAGRILDFLSGAIYGLNGSIVRVKDDQFILTPDGSKILKPSDPADGKNKA